MSWLSRLYETYEIISANESLNKGLEPYFHKLEKCHLEVVLTDSGKFSRARSLVTYEEAGGKKKWNGESTLIPITPKSLTGRTSGSAPYALAEKIHYLAPNYLELGGTKKSYYQDYIDQLSHWCRSEFKHQKAEAVLNYISEGTLLNDLIKENLIYVYECEGKEFLITNWKAQAEEKSSNEKPDIFFITGMKDQGQLMVRWVVESDGDPNSSTWDDSSLHEAWINYQKFETSKDTGFCQILGKQAFITNTHPKGIIQTKDANGAKLISKPTDDTYLTYQGRFHDQEDAVSISFEVSQKSHNALRWLLRRQGRFIGENSMLVAWAVSGKTIPPPLAATTEFGLDSISSDTALDDFDEISDYSPPSLDESVSGQDHSLDLGHSFATKLSRYMHGYRATLSDIDQISIMAIDSATPGRMGITYYRETLPKSYLDRITQWHVDMAWPQRVEAEANQQKDQIKGDARWSIGAPSPFLILKSAYGDMSENNKALRKNTVERILPCITDNQKLPLDIVNRAIKRACNRNAKRLPEQYSSRYSELAAWEKELSVACSLYKGYLIRNTERSEISMALEESSTSRDYLYGRLLALADNIESYALNKSDEKRPTSAERLMQRFADRPFSTWRNIELALQPYINRLKSGDDKSRSFVYSRNSLMEEIQNLFVSSEQFKLDKALTGEFLLGFHCQRLALRKKPLEKTTIESESTEEQGA